MENAANLSLLTKFPSAEYMRVEYPLLQTTSSTKIIFIYNFSTNKIFQWKSIKILAIVKKNPYERVEYIQIVHIYYIRFQAIFLRAPLKKKKKKGKTFMENAAISLFSRNFLLQDICIEQNILFFRLLPTKIIFIYNFSTNLSYDDTFNNDTLITMKLFNEKV